MGLELRTLKQEGILEGLDLTIKRIHPHYDPQNGTVPDDENEVVLTYDSLSDGERMLLGRMALLFLLKHQEGSLLLLDEPETHFNDVWKREIIDIVDESILKNTSVQVFVATHSSIALTVRTWDVESGNCLREKKGFDAGVNFIAAMPDGRCAVASAHKIRVWDLETNESSQTVEAFEALVVPGVSGWAIQGTHLAAGMCDGSVRFFCIEGFHVGFVTPTRIWHFGEKAKRGHWDKRLTIVCPLCSTRSAVSSDACNQRISCEHCQASMQVNPFVCDLADGLE